MPDAMTAADVPMDEAFRFQLAALEECAKWEGQKSVRERDKMRQKFWRWHREEVAKAAKAAWTAALGGDTYGFEEWYHADA